MAQGIKDGSTGNIAKVDSNKRVHTFAVSRSVSAQALFDGDAYNINSGLVTLTTAGESGILYFRNNEDRDIKVESIVLILGPSTGGSATDTTRVRIYRNPTTGTLISTALAAETNLNRNFGSSNNLTESLAYKGAEGNTVTDGSIFIESLVSPGNRAPISINVLLKKGNSIAVTYEPNDSTTSMKVMCAIVCSLAVSTDS